MNRKILIGTSICAVVLLVMASLSNVVGYQTVTTSQQNLINERINQRELAFQTICDIANNKEIQRIILKSQMSRGVFPTSDIPVITKNQLKQMFFIGLLLSKVISKSRIQSMVERYQFITPKMQQKIYAVIEKDATVKAEITQLQTSECDCEKENAEFRYPVIICGTIMFTYLGLYLLWEILIINFYYHHRPLNFIIGLITEIVLIFVYDLGRLINCF
jgi:hypothetical protein